jgi:microcystin-dependent protein
MERRTSMTEPYTGEIRMFAGTYAPRHWAFCDGQVLAIDGNEALFSLLGTTYGGDGRTTFALPDLRGRLPMHAGEGIGLSPRRLGERAGLETHTLTEVEIPGHSHPIQAGQDDGTVSEADSRTVLSKVSEGMGFGTYVADRKVAYHQDAVQINGGNGAHTNMMPYLCINFIIALAGAFPPRN